MPEAPRSFHLGLVAGAAVNLHYGKTLCLPGSDAALEITHTQVSIADKLGGDPLTCVSCHAVDHDVRAGVVVDEVFDGRDRWSGISAGLKIEISASNVRRFLADDIDKIDILRREKILELLGCQVNQRRPPGA